MHHRPSVEWHLVNLSEIIKALKEMDENKWIDNVLCLHESAKKLLLGIHAIKQILKKPNQLEKDLVIDDILFKPIAIQEFKTQSLDILSDASLSSVR